MVVPGRVKPCSGSDHVHDALALVVFVEIFDAEIARVFREHRDLLGAFRIRIGQRAVGGRHVVVDNGERLFRRAHFAPRQAQAFERLRRSHFMHEMTVDIEQAGAVILLMHQMVVPDLVVEGTRFHGCLGFSNSKKAERVFAQRAYRPRRSKTGQNCRRHLAKEPPRQARMVLQHDGAIEFWPSGIHLSHITIARLKAQ